MSYVCNNLTIIITVCIKITNMMYCIAGKFGEFGKSSVIRQIKTIQICAYN